MWMQRLDVLYVTGLLILSVGACSQLPLKKLSGTTSIELDDGLTPARMKETGAAKIVAPTSLPPPISSKGKQHIVEVGSGEFVADVEPTKEDPSEPGNITLNFQDTDIREFIKVVMGDVLKKNYVIDEKVVGKVTIATASPVRKDTLMNLLEDVLAMNGAAVVKENDIYRILQKNQVVKGNLSPALTRQIAEGYSVRIIPLEFIAAQEMQKILEPFLAEGSELQIDIKRNLVVIAGSQQEIATVQDTVDVFDVDWLRGMSVGLYPLDYVEPTMLKAELDAVLGAIEADNSNELLGGIVRTVPIERLQSILLISSTPAGLREVEIWIHRLDRPGKSVDKRLYVYNVQNAKATDLGEILGHIFDTASAPTSAPAGGVQLAPGLSPVEIIADGSQSADGGQASNNSVATQSTGDGDGGVALPSGQPVEIIADDVRNALVILATPQDYKMVEIALTKLDVVPLQVLIEASIIEVSLNDDLNYGIEWFFKNSIERGNVTEGRGTLDLGDVGLSALAPSFSYTIFDNADQVRIALNILEQESEVNVLSSPSLMVLNNQTAFISVGDEIPVPARQSISNINPDSPTVNEIQFRQTGVTLTVTPRVNSSGLVTMEIKQEVSNAVSTTSSDIDAPTIQLRQIESTVAINSGETIVLGGLIQDTETNAESGIPVLRRIPLLGKLFGQTRDEMRRTELLVMITPRVIQNRNEARGVTEEFKRKLRGITPLTQQGLEEAGS